MQPNAGVTPMTLDSYGRNAKDFADFLVTKSSEISKFHNLSFFRILCRKPR